MPDVEQLSTEQRADVTTQAQQATQAAPASPVASPVTSVKPEMQTPAVPAAGKPSEATSATQSSAENKDVSASPLNTNTETSAPATPANSEGQTPVVMPSAEAQNVSVSLHAETAPAPGSLNTSVLHRIPDMILTVRPVEATIKAAARLSWAMKAFLLAVFLPTLLAFIYFWLWASPMYVAETRFAVRGADAMSAASGLASLLLPSAVNLGVDARIVAEYIQAPDIMEAIDADMGIFKHFSSHDHDIISRLSSSATRDDKLWYWQWMVRPSLDPESGIIALSVKAYDPETAKKLAEAVLTKSEELVNTMSRRAQEDAIALAATEVKTAEIRVRKAQDAMRAFRERTGMLDIASTAGGLQGIVRGLEGESVKLRAEIAAASTYMSKDAPALIGLHARLDAVEKQLASEKLRLAGEARPDSLTSFAAEYEALKTESEFAGKQLVSAMTSLETARVKAEAQSRYVVAFEKPALSDESLFPRPFLFTVYVFAGALALATLLSLIIAAVREHAGF